MLAGSKHDHRQSYCEHRDSCVRTPTRASFPLRAIEHSPHPHPPLSCARRSEPSLRACQLTIQIEEYSRSSFGGDRWRLMLMIKARAATLITSIGMHDGEGRKA